MIILGIESTAHTFGVGIVKDGKVIVNVKDSYITKKGGMIPPKVADHHVEVFDEVIKKALAEAHITMKDVTAIAYSSSPGIGHSLRIGCMAAKVLANKYKIPLVPVNHCIAHLEIGNITGAKDPVLLYASGANTQIIAYEAGKYRIFGETLDIGVGNFIDSFALAMGLGFPGGPLVSALADKGNKYIELPYSVKGMDVAFGGILTNLKNKLNQGNFSKEDLSFSTQETVFAMLLETAERAMAHCDKDELVLGGGVACNKRLQKMAHKMCEERGAKCFIPENQFLVDNGGMIAYLGAIMYNAGHTVSVKDATINPYERTDDVDVDWK
ncbi:UGMP family protein [Candidatus Woesearchaeota archaeon CG11_big_fil_rev_8_21_14_0_20_43_8]|nr:MAG: UGMP family protein [Candidatus Woesearchaeota archaeon CG11_big_fil_rev_8_21_14_0_20_43_8]PIO06717.1 MAG: UGMP family protein [Candidatus Woesearchaeota archaeon CG08_land_8_20_14_0_20_43_7]